MVFEVLRDNYILELVFEVKAESKVGVAKWYFLFSMKVYNFNIHNNLKGTSGTHSKLLVSNKNWTKNGKLKINI